MQAHGLQTLLSALDPDENRAAHEYRRMHERLVRFFALNRVADPHALADEAIDRLSRRIAEDNLQIDSIPGFLSGIARHLVQEESRRQIREQKVAHEWMTHHAVLDASDDQLPNAMEDCLASQKPETQQLLRSYYTQIGQQKISHHQQLAQERGISLNALRNRVMRARKELDNCIRGKLRDVSAQTSTKR